jgi:hypothetical protein
MGDFVFTSCSKQDFDQTADSISDCDGINMEDGDPITLTGTGEVKITENSLESTLSPDQSSGDETGAKPQISTIH